MKKITDCYNCGSEDIEWLSKSISTSGAQDGHLKINEIHTVYYLACHECGETLQFLNESQGLTLLNMSYFK